MEISGTYLVMLLVGAVALGAVFGVAYGYWRAQRRQLSTGTTDAERLADIIDLAADWVWETDADHRYTYVSPRLIERTGLPLEHWLNATRFDTLALAHDREVVEAHITDILAHRPFRDLDTGSIGQRACTASRQAVSRSSTRTEISWGTAAPATTLLHEKRLKRTSKRPTRNCSGSSAS